MKKRIIATAGILTAAFLIFWVVFSGKLDQPVGAPGSPHATTSRDAVPRSKISQDLPANTPPRPRLFKSTRYPPETPEEKAMWEWWNTMMKLDPAFEWKTPIEFYGKVVDQFGEQVPGATVDISWTMVNGSRTTQRVTDSAGLFEFTREKGKHMSVFVSKDGYLPTRESKGGYEYAAFHEPQFHVPDKAAPVVFRLQRLMESEPYYEFPVYGRFPADGTPIRLSLADGKLGAGGELLYRVKLEETGKQEPGYSVVVEATDGIEIAATSEEFPFLAPESDYVSRLEVHQRPGNPDYHNPTVLKLYVKLPGGKYAYVGTTATLWVTNREVALSGGVRYNERWSRNLEADHHKRINRR